MFGEMVPIGSSSKTSMRASALWAKAIGEDLKTSASPVVAAALRRNSLRFIIGVFPRRIVNVHSTPYQKLFPSLRKFSAGSFGATNLPLAGIGVTSFLNCRMLFFHVRRFHLRRDPHAFWEIWRSAVI